MVSTFEEIEMKIEMPEDWEKPVMAAACVVGSYFVAKATPEGECMHLSTQGLCDWHDRPFGMSIWHGVVVVLLLGVATVLILQALWKEKK